MSMEPDPSQQSSSYYSKPPTPDAPQPGVTAAAGQTNGFAIAALVLGLLGIIPFVGMPVIPSILALVFGYKGKAEIDRSNGYQQGRGMAVAGIILGWVGIVVGVFFGLFALAWILSTWSLF